MAGVIMRKDLAEQLDPMSQPQTFAANALSAVVCMTNIDILMKNDLISRAGDLGEEIINKLKDASSGIELIGEVRGRGLMIGIELVTNRQTREPIDGETMNNIVGGLLSNGIIMVPCGRYGNVLRLMPSLTITRNYMHKGVDILLGVLRGIKV